MPNHLAGETSPYLLQHAHNPVDWRPWGPDALERARAEGKPILLSIGYAACHWCHVMERESFEDEATAAQMNEQFVCIKVDREERPDLDAIYMQATQAMTGHGGWPMTVFLTPEAEPFYAGTYFPPDDRHGMPSFRRVLAGVADAWHNRKDNVARTTASMRDLYSASTERTRVSGTLDESLLTRAVATLRTQFEPRFGGFGGAPKFPPTMTLDFALRSWARTGQPETLHMVTHTFRRMARGGIYDQVGGGFARYSVDAYWLVPHFEKMLYDNALLVRLGAALWQATRDEEVRRVTVETLEWLSREMTSPEGGFYSSLDADSEGHEGRYYVWDSSELDSLLGEDASLLRAYWGVTPEGNFEGRNILFVPHDPDAVANAQGVTVPELRTAVDRARRILYEARERRVRPGLDDKILASWNGLMLRGVAEAARAFGDAELRALAVRNGEFLFRELVRGDRVLRSYKGGTSKIAGFLEDHAAVALGALAVYELTFERMWLERARRLADEILARFWDDGAHALFDTASDAESLVTRPRDVTDNATPSGTSLAIELLLKLGDLFATGQYSTRGRYLLETVAEPMARYPNAFGHALGAADLAVRGAIEVAIMGDPADERLKALASAVAERYLPSLVLAGGSDGDGVALLEGRGAEVPMAYVCRAYACDAPTSEADVLRDQLDAILTAATASAPTSPT
ncbi:MAG TPA: thioredoxin domain-containing protein [Gemmatimonadaceae bacterium]|nr:thioredoxin domain-containing protein [Gemmatimonadaceae bacterium]